MSKSLLSYETLSHAVAGSCGSICAMVLSMPLDTARVRTVLDEENEAKSTIKTIMDIVKSEGITSLFRGGLSTVQCVAISNFIYFYTFHGLKKAVSIGGKQSAKKDLIFAFVAGVTNVLLTNPIWVVNIHLKMQDVEKRTQKMQGLCDGVLKIAQSEGVSELWSGASSSLILVSNPTIKFTCYELLKRFFAPEVNLGSLKAFTLGAASSLVATILTYPLQVVQTKSRFTRKTTGSQKTKKLWEQIVYLYRNFGASIFFKGLEAKILQTILSAGFMFLAYEKIFVTTTKIMRVK